MRSNICDTAAKMLYKAPRISIVYHWDTDGVASAALVMRKFGDKVVRLSVPRIGLYSIEAIPLPSDDSLLLILDYGLSGRLYERLSYMYRAELIVIDHHSVIPPQERINYCNPVAYGEGTEEDYPANSFLVYKIIGDSRDVYDRILAALGIAGDLAPYIDASLQHSGLVIAKRLLEDTDTSLQELRLIAELIDSCYRVLDIECLRRAVRLASRNPLDLVNDAQLANAKWRSEMLLKNAWKQLKQVQRDKNVVVYNLVMDAYITSAIGRKLASNEPDKIIVLVHSIPSQQRGIIYVRSIVHRLDKIRDKLRAKGVPVAGKTHVLVIDYENNNYSKYLRHLLNTIHDCIEEK